MIYSFWLVAVFVATLTCGLPFEMAALYFALIQIMLALYNKTQNWEDIDMKHIFMVGSGTHGVVR